MRPFAATNEPGTCLWCGDRLRYTCTTKRAGTGRWRPPARCESCKTDVYSEGVRRAPNEWEAVEGEEGLFRCRVCGGEEHGREVEKIVSRERDSERPGRYHDGHFCSLTCGHRFGCTLADGGRRLQPKDQP